MNLAVISFFRNSVKAGYLSNYFRQLDSLRNHMDVDDNLRLIAVEGDSVDNTADALDNKALAFSIDMQRVERSHGQRVFGSTEHPDRLAALSWLGNGGLEAVSQGDDMVLYVESDLRWDAGTIMRLVDRVMSNSSINVVSPLVFAGEHFYDVFCFRDLAGNRFAPFPPYSAGLDECTLAEVSSVGSCLVMDAQVARQCRIPGSEVLIGFCRVARSSGYRIWVDAAERIYHP